jgi:protein TonB
MFDQTFVDGTQRTKNPVTVAFSFSLQIVALAIFTLIPLVYTEGLPSAQLRNLLLAPSPPLAPVHTSPITQKLQPKQAFHPINSKLLFAPHVIPPRINTIEEAAPAVDMGVPGGVAEQSTGNGMPPGLLTSIAPPPPAPPVAKSATHSAPVPVGGNVAEANLIHRVQPVYPPLAKSARVQGTVEFTATISKEGNIEHLQLVRGHPLLVNAARDAVLQWKYRPTLLNGQPVEVITDILVNFTLSQ